MKNKSSNSNLTNVMKKSIFYLLLILSSSCFSQKNKESTKITKELDAIVKEYADSNEFTGSVLIAQNGKILLRKAYGYADMEKRIPNQPETNFYLASVSKLFTNAAIIKLKDKGLLSLNDPLSKFIPDYPNGERISIRHLIEHNSGIVDFVNDRPFELMKDEIGLDSLILLFKYLPLKFEPGTNYSYCSSGYNLLAFIIEKTSGMSYSDYIEKEIFSELGMNSSYSDWNHFPENQAKGYHKESGKLVPTSYFHPSQFLGSGNLTSTVDDLYKWYNVIYKTGIISSEHQIPHFGRIGGWTSTCFIPNGAADYVIILLSNYGDAPADMMVNELREVLNRSNEAYIKLTSSEIKKLEGYYDYGIDGIMVVREEDGKLFAQLSGQNENEIFPKSKTEFFWSPIEASVKFEQNKEGEITHAVHRQNGISNKYPKIPAIQLTSSELKILEGTYDYGVDGIMVVRVQEGQLFAQLSGQNENEIFPKSKTEFFWMVVNASVKFIPDSTGLITQVIHSQNGQTILAPKNKD